MGQSTSLQATLNDGQVGTAAGAIFTNSIPALASVSVTLSNLSAVLTETILLTLVRAAGGTRRVGRMVLPPNGQGVVQNVPMAYGDSLVAGTTDPGTVDFVVYQGQQGGTLSLTTFDATGSVQTAYSANPTYVNLTLTGLLVESNQASITAGTTRTQAGATALTKEVNRVDTSTAVSAGSIVGDGVALPMSQAGLDITVINNTLNPIQVYPNNADTQAVINGIAGSTGVSIPPGDVAHFECASPADWRFEAGMGSTGSLPLELSCENITAVTPAAQNTAFVLPGVINHVTTVNAAGAAVALQAAKYGLTQAVENATANSLTVYPANGGSDVINGQSANTPVIIPPFTTAVFRAASAGTWQSDPYFNNVGAMPSSGTVQMGSATTGGARSGGNSSVQVSSAGNGNAADTTDDVLFTYALPANALDVANRQVTITVAGKFAGNGNNKRIKVWWGTTSQTVGQPVAGGTLIADSGVQTTNGGGWNASVQVTKYGANGSNTQIATNAQVVAGASHLGTTAPTLLTAAENGAINITVTGSSGSSAANDVVAQLLDVLFNN